MRSERETGPATIERTPPPAIAVEDVSVTYRVRRERPTTRSLLQSLTSRAGSTHRIQALRGVSFEVERGTILGVIGKNGAGKSTLLRAIAGIVPPTRGRITVRGDVTPLFGLGVGFNRKLTGRDNVHLGALASGLDGPQVKAKLQDIIDFAELGKFIDYPVSSYSSGMKGRLGFAVAAHLDPDILLIDEALAAGDGAFKVKCRERIKEMCGEGRTVLVVTHGMGTVLEMAHECLWLHEGRAKRFGTPKETVEAYMKFSRLKASGLVEDEDDDAVWSEDV